MIKQRSVLIAGESWVTHSIHQKGFDSFTTTAYAEGVGWLRAALEANGWEVTYQPCHIAARDFPATPEALAAFDCVILSDIGANTLLLHPETSSQSRVLPNRLEAIRRYVAEGGGFVMVGGYLTFQGIEAKAQYAGSPIEDILPVTLSRFDERVEAPQGVTPRIVSDNHEILADIGRNWPELLGYNRVFAKENAQILVEVGQDILLAAGTYGKGRTIAFTSDCGPHWAPPQFVDWEGYPRLWHQIVAWAAARG